MAERLVMKNKFLILLIPIVLLVTGCSLSGYGGTSTFNCSAPEGVSCNSISGNYANSVAGTLPLQTKNSAKNKSNLATSFATKTPKDGYNPANRETLESGMPIRSQTEILRLWIAPWLDNDGDLVDQSYTYVTLNEGRWLIEHNRKQIIDEYKPVRLLGSQNNQAAKDSVKSTSTTDTVPNLGIVPPGIPQ